MKTTTTRLFLSLAFGFLVSGLAEAGNLDSPGPPAPTMVTLDQIGAKLGGLAAVPKTGQTGCWDASGASISCVATGQDGSLQKGVTTSPRFTDNGDGTVKDNLTGLIWLRNANCFSSRSWSNALSDANALAAGSCGLTDGSVAGTWRLPNVKELYSLIDLGHFFPALPAGHPFSFVQSSAYWSSTTNAYGPTTAWYVNMDIGSVIRDPKANAYYVWPVRDAR